MEKGSLSPQFDKKVSNHGTCQRCTQKSRFDIHFGCICSTFSRSKLKKGFKISQKTTEKTTKTRFCTKGTGEVKIRERFIVSLVALKKCFAAL